MTAIRDDATTETLAVARIAPTGLASAREGRPMSDEERRVVELQREIAELREAVQTREQIGWVCGLLAQRLELSQEQVWQLLVQLSQNTNVKLREVARIISAAHAGTLAVTDQPVAVRLNRQLESLI